MVYSDGSDRIVRRLRAQLQFFADEHTRAATAAWVRAWDDVALPLEQALVDLTADGVRPTRSQLLRAQRLQNALWLIESRLSEAFEASAVAAIADLRMVVDAAGVATDQLISSMLPDGANVSGWARVDPAQVDAIVTRSTEQITKLSFPLAAEATATMKRELVRGVLVGSNPRETARRMVAKSRSTFNGGLPRALTIARTEMLDAHRAAAALSEKQSSDVLAGWVWVAALSERTCPACWGMHGSLHDLDEPGPEGHQNCRCARVPRTKTWRELGFDIDEPPSLLPDGEALFGALTPGQQLNILGPSRYAAWKAGEFPMTAWASKRSTPGWRDSWVPSKAPAGFRGTRRAALDDTTKPWQFGRGAKLLSTGPRQALRQIQQVHDVPLLLEPVKILPMAHATKGQQGRFTPADLTIRINPKAISKGLTTVHEFGHYLDFRDFGEGVRMASRSSGAPEWLAFRAVVAKSPEVKGILRAKSLDVPHAEYLARDPELFARAYAQWIALRSGSRSLARDLARMRKLPGVDGMRQWSDESFEPIAEALDRLFGSRMHS